MLSFFLKYSTTYIEAEALLIACCADRLLRCSTLSYRSHFRRKCKNSWCSFSRFLENIRIQIGTYVRLESVVPKYFSCFSSAENLKKHVKLDSFQEVGTNLVPEELMKFTWLCERGSTFSLVGRAMMRKKNEKQLRSKMVAAAPAMRTSMTAESIEMDVVHDLQLPYIAGCLAFSLWR